MVFDDNERYTLFIENVFNANTTVETFNILVLVFMKLVEDDDANSRSHISDEHKHQVVRNAISMFLRFTNLSNDERDTLLRGLDTLINTIQIAGDGALSGVIDDVLDHAAGSWCCCFGEVLEPNAETKSEPVKST